ncbi:LysR family transcriptional regulator [Silvimonas sp. JCM 19000]
MSIISIDPFDTHFDWMERSMELRQLEYFVAVAETLHFGRAAERLGMTQPPLSQQIQALERDLGAQLFERTNRRVLLTGAGQVLLDNARTILQAVARTREQVQRAHRGETGELRLGFTPSAPFTEAFSQVLRELRTEMPQVNLVLNEMSSQAQVNALIERQLDIGMIRGLSLPAGIEAMEVNHEPMVVVLPSDHPAAQGDPAVPIPLAHFAHEDFVCFPRNIGIALYEQIMALCRAAGFKPRVTQEAREPSTQIALVAAGFGIAILTGLQQRIQVDKVTYRTLADEGARTAVWMIYRKERHSELVQGVIDRVRARSTGR